MYLLILISAAMTKWSTLPDLVPSGSGQLPDDLHQIQNSQKGTANHSPMTCARLTCRLPGS